MAGISIPILRQQVKTMSDVELAAYAAEQNAIVLQADGAARGLADLRLRIAKEEQATRQNPWRL